VRAVAFPRGLSDAAQTTGDNYAGRPVNAIATVLPGSGSRTHADPVISTDAPPPRSARGSMRCYYSDPKLSTLLGRTAVLHPARYSSGSPRLSSPWKPISPPPLPGRCPRRHLGFLRGRAGLALQRWQCSSTSTETYSASRPSTHADRTRPADCTGHLRCRQDPVHPQREQSGQYQASAPSASVVDLDTGCPEIDRTRWAAAVMVWGQPG
jgi:hypothetical protein